MFCKSLSLLRKIYHVDHVPPYCFLLQHKFRAAHRQSFILARQTALCCPAPHLSTMFRSKSYPGSFPAPSQNHVSIYFWYKVLFGVPPQIGNMIYFQCKLYLGGDIHWGCGYARKFQEPACWRKNKILQQADRFH